MAMCCHPVREKGQGIGGRVLRCVGIHPAIMDRGHPKGGQVMPDKTGKIKTEMIWTIGNKAAGRLVAQ